MRLLLDTNVVVWLLLGERGSIPGDVAAVIAEPETQSFVSAASVWEIAIKRSIGRLEIEPHWRRVLSGLDLDHLPITADHAARVEGLPWHHRDPFDRLLIAQALAERCILVTADRTLDRYEVETWWG
ncbi:MAG TPA: type II toxin-antitoxin system VapC family toxin [Actinomycetales bacterium]|nr:type II toxin-antitoxin system VapC family toxin [Actinomycetales bacterium]